MDTGVIKILDEKERSWYTAKDVQSLLGVSQAKAYKLIRNTRLDCVKKGTLAEDYPEGKVPKKFFNKRYALD